MRALQAIIFSIGAALLLSASSAFNQGTFCTADNAIGPIIVGNTAVGNASCKTNMEAKSEIVRAEWNGLSITPIATTVGIQSKPK